MNKPEPASASAQLPAEPSPGQAEPVNHAPAASQGDGISLARAVTDSARREDGTGAQLFDVLGHHAGLLYFRVRGEVLWLAPAQLGKAGTALLLVPDIDHWRALSGDPSRRLGVDWKRIAADLTRRAYEVGPFPEGQGYRWPSMTKGLRLRQRAEAAA